MAESENTLDDFPDEAFTIFVYCDTCDHSGSLDRAKIPTGMTIEELRKALRCSRCGSSETSIRIVYTGAGGFEYCG